MQTFIVLLHTPPPGEDASSEVHQKLKAAGFEVYDFADNAFLARAKGTISRDVARAAGLTSGGGVPGIVFKLNRAYTPASRKHPGGSGSTCTPGVRSEHGVSTRRSRGSRRRDPNGHSERGLLIVHCPSESPSSRCIGSMQRPVEIRDRTGFGPVRGPLGRQPLAPAVESQVSSTPAHSAHRSVANAALILAADGGLRLDVDQDVH